MTMNYGFMGSGHFAARCLELLAEWLEPQWVVTACPSPAGRGLKLRPTAVDDLATARGWHVHRSDAASRDDEIVSRARAADFVFVVDFGQMIKPPLLDAAICLNIHPSLLPLYRGCAPVQRAVMDGASETGVTIFRLVPAMDAGPILLQERFPIEEKDTSGDIFERAAKIAARSFTEFASTTPVREWSFTEQGPEWTYAAKIEKSECHIDWGRHASEILNLIRGLQPAPIAYTFICGKRLRVISARRAPGHGDPGSLLACESVPVIACHDGAIELEVVQLEGKKPQGACDWLNGSRLTQGERFS